VLTPEAPPKSSPDKSTNVSTFEAVTIQSHEVLSKLHYRALRLGLHTVGHLANIITPHSCLKEGFLPALLLLFPHTTPLPEARHLAVASTHETTRVCKIEDPQS